MKKTDLKLVGLMVGAVFAAGLLMAQFQNVGIVAQAKSGYN